MITKGQTFTFMYETRNKNTGALVPDASATHTITVFYQGSSGWTSAIITANNGQNGKSPVAYNASSPAFPAYVGSTDTGLYLCQISSSYTDCEHVIVNITSSNTDVIVPIQQFYPVATNALAASVWSNATRQLTSRVLDDGKPTHDEIALNGEVSITVDSNNIQATIPSADTIASTVWNYSNGARALTTASIGSNSYLATSTDVEGIKTYGDAHWVSSGSSSGNNSITTVDTSSLATQVSRLEGYVDTLATNVGYLSTHTQTITSAATTLFSGTNSLASTVEDIPKDVWTYTTYSDIANHQPVKAIADTVWGRSQNGTNRQLTSATLGAVGAGSLAKSTDVAAPVIDSEDIQLTIPTAIDVATAVWNYGKTTNAEITDYRALSTSTIIAKNGTTSLDVATVSTGSSTVDNVVWSAQTRTLSSEVLDNTKSLAVSTDIPEAPDVSDLTTIVTLLTKVLGVLCHWKEDGNNIIVYNDDNETILTIPTVKNKYGDILQMGEIPEEE